MNAERLKVLETVLERGSLSAAADTLGYTTSGVSRMMETLEKETGLTLLVRGKNGVEATEECRMLLPSIHAYLRMDESLRQQADEIRGVVRGKITVGNAYYGIYPRLEKAIRIFQKKYPGIEISLVPGITSELLQKLTDHEIDMALTTIRPEERRCVWKKIGTDEMVAWVPEENRLAGRKTFPISSFETEDYIDLYPGKDTDNRRILAAAGISPKTKMSTFDSYAAWTMVEAGLGVAMNSLLNSTFPEGAVRILPIEPRISLEVGIAFRQDPSPAMRHFLAFAEENLINPAASFSD